MTSLTGGGGGCSVETDLPLGATVNRAYEAEVLGLLGSVLEERILRLVESGAALPDPQALVDAMAAGIPDASGPAEYARTVGPFYSSRGVMRLLDVPSKQALDDRRRRGTLLAARTSDAVWVYPAFQFDPATRRVRPGISAALAELKAAPRWGSILWLVTAHPDLDGQAPREAAEIESLRPAVVELAREYAFAVSA